MKRIKLEVAEQVLSDYWADYMIDCKSKNLSDATIRSYNNHIGILSKTIPMNITVSELEKNAKLYYSQILECPTRKKNSSVSYLRTMRAFVNYINQKGYKIPVPACKTEKTVKNTYTDEELKMIVSRPSGKDFIEYRDWLICCLLIDTGMRAGTLINIKKEDIQDGYIIYRHMKEHNSMIVPVSKTIQTELKKYMSMIDTDYLFTSCYGEQLTNGALYHSIKKYLAKKGISGTIHDFRRTFIKKCIDMNLNAFTIQKLCGHKSIDTTLMYVNLYDHNILDAFKDGSPLESLKRKRVKI